MSTPSLDRKEIIRQALRRIEELEAQLADAARARREPIAVVGLGCRLPGGVDGPESFWRRLGEGFDGIREVPSDRWNLEAYFDPRKEAPGKTHTRWGGFLEHIDRGDPQFFGISRREMLRMDPQQRLFLEVAWEALEDAGQAPGGLKNSRTGVFVGVTLSEFLSRHFKLREPSLFDAYLATGNVGNAIAGRVSFTLGLQGPSLAVDTACSSSLVAVHLACQGLRAGECDLALAGGVNVTLLPETVISFSKWGMMADDGRCKTFDAAADGFVRGEGCGVVVLRRLSEALARRDRILALIRGSAVNQDGPSSGLTVPNGLAQEAVVREALEAAGVQPGDIGYVEAHGTGTRLGDPIEVEALAAVHSRRRPPDDPLLIGSVKTNIGHLESASGIAGLIKTVLILTHGEIPPHRHLRTPTPHVAWERIPIRVPTAATPWPAGGRPRRAGVSAFGFSGTNAHVVLEEAPAPAPAPAAPERPLHLLALSAKTPEARSALARAFRAHLERHPELDPGDAAFTANAGRSHFPCRAAVLGGSLGELAEGLARLAEEAAAGPQAPRIAFLFTGQGSQYPGMGRGLYEGQPTFRRAIDRCAELLEPHLRVPLPALLFEASAAGGALDETAHTQPALFALEYALAELWQSWGILPAAMMGHSLGEYVAACRAGVLSLEAALTLVAERARLMQALPGRGSMAAVFADRERVAAAIAEVGRGVSVAALNGPASLVVSGPREGVEAVLERLAEGGVGHRRLNVSHAFHSELMEPMLEAFAAATGRWTYGRPQTPLVSNVSGRFFDDRNPLDPDYLVRHIRQPVQFEASLRCLQAHGCDAFLEIGPGTTLLSLGRQCLPEDDGLWRPSLRRQRDDWRQMLESLGDLYVRGAEVDWEGFDRDYPRRRVALPTYPFQRQRFPIPQDPAGGTAAGTHDAAAPVPHPLVRRRSASPLIREVLGETLLRRDDVPYLEDHTVAGQTVVPATLYVELALWAARDRFPGGGARIANLVLHRPLVLHGDAPAALQTVVTPEAGDRAAVRIIGLPAPGRGPAGRHTLLASATLLPPGDPPSAAPFHPEDLLGEASQALPLEAFYTAVERRGVRFGERFRGLVELHRGDGQALGRIRPPAADEGPAAGYALHPARLDACFQVSGALWPPGDEVYLPMRIEALRWYGPAEGELWCRAALGPPAGADPAALSAELQIVDGRGRPVAAVEGLVQRRLDPRDLARLVAGRTAPDLYALTWVPAGAPLPAASLEAGAEPPAGAWIVFADRGGLGDRLAARLRDKGRRAIRVQPGPAFAPGGDGAWRIDPRNPEHFRRLLETHPCAGLVYLWGLDAAAIDEATPPEAVEPALQAGLEGALHAAQAAAAGAPGSTPPRVWLATRGAAPVDAVPQAPSLAQAPLWGFGRTVAREHPELHCTLVDLDPDPPPDEAERLLETLLGGALGGDGGGLRRDQIALRGGERLLARLVGAADAGPAAASPGSAGEPVRLENATPGILEGLRYRPAARRPPGPGQVEIEVRATGLNFRDVLNAMGMYPGDPVPLGTECAGTVAALGAEVAGLRVGDPVLAVAPGSFDTYACAPAELVALKPAGLDHATAAGIPSVFLTAHFALHRLAGLAAGERILIHAAAGGVGLAAVQLARRAGAEVFATAGRPEKRRYLESLGVTQVYSSRDLDFAERIRERTGGQGVAVVLNSLSGAFIPKSLEVLAPGGRFVELGKRGIWSPEQAARQRPDAAYHVLDLAQTIADQPDLVRRVLAELLQELAAGALQPLPTKVFPAAAVASAFRFMAQARHIGKIVVARPQEPRRDGAGPTAPRRGADPPLPGTYLVTGGLSGLGLCTAGWLAERGAQRLVLMGRRPPSPAAEEALQQMRAAGAQVAVVRGDVSSADDVERAVRREASTGPALRGVFHCAGVLEDAMLAGQSWERFRPVLAAKCRGSWNLHRHTRELDLDWFVLFSSAAALLGAAGQANYAAACAFQDGLAHYRRARGLPALSINWGPWAEIGMARGPAVAGRLQAQGMRPFAPRAGLEVLARLLPLGLPQVLALEIDWQAYLAAGDPAAQPDLLAAWAPPTGKGGRPADAAAPAPEQAGPAVRLQGVDPPEALKRLQAHVRRTVRQVLELDPAAALDDRQGFRDLGMDSLLSVELKNRLQASLGRSLPATVAFDYPTVEALTGFLRPLVIPPEPPAGGGPEAGEAPLQQLAAEMAQLSEAEAEARLLQELAQIKAQEP